MAAKRSFDQAFHAVTRRELDKQPARVPVPLEYRGDSSASGPDIKETASWASPGGQLRQPMKQCDPGLPGSGSARVGRRPVGSAQLDYSLLDDCSAPASAQQPVLPLALVQKQALVGKSGPQAPIFAKKPMLMGMGSWRLRSPSAFSPYSAFVPASFVQAPVVARLLKRSQ